MLRLPPKRSWLSATADIVATGPPPAPMHTLGDTHDQTP